MATITEDYVSFKVAKLLKEKGFDEKLQYYYDTDGILVRCRRGQYFNNKSNAFIAPTQAMAMKWLREVHNLFIEVQYATCLLFQPHNTIYFQIYYMSFDYSTSGKNMLLDDYIREYYTSYEKACEAAIKYCLENLI